MFCSFHASQCYPQEHSASWCLLFIDKSNSVMSIPCVRTLNWKFNTGIIHIHAYVRCQLATGIAHIQLWLQWLWNQQLCVPCKCLCENELHSCQACSSARRIELHGRHQRVQLTRTCTSGSSFDTHKLVFCDDAPRVCTMVDNVNQLGKIGAKSVTHEHETSTLAKCLESHILIKKYLIKMQTTLACSVVKCW